MLQLRRATPQRQLFSAVVTVSAWPDVIRSPVETDQFPAITCAHRPENFGDSSTPETFTRCFRSMVTQVPRSKCLMVGLVYWTRSSSDVNGSVMQCEYV